VFRSLRYIFREAPYVLMALELVLVYFYILELFKPNYTVLLHGIIWVSVYRLGLLDQGFYGLIPLILVSLALGLCVYLAGGFTVIKASKLAHYILVLLTTINCLLLLYWMTYALSPPTSLDYGFSPHKLFLDLEAGLFHVYAPIYPLLLLVMLYTWVPLAICKIFKGRVRLKIRCNSTLNTVSNYRPSDDIFMRRLGLTSALLLSIALPLIPYLPSINPEFKPVSVDIRYYSMWLGNMLTSDCWGAVEYAFYGTENGNRPLYLLLLYGLTNLRIPKEIVLNFEALFITPLFTLTIYFTAKRLFGDNLQAFLSSLAGLLGFNMTVGMFAGIFAAWTGLTLFYLCIILVSSLPSSRWCLAGAIASSVALLFIHPWTWSLLMCVLTVNLASSLRCAEVDKYLLAVLIVNAIVDALKTLMFPNYGGLICSAISLSSRIGLNPLLDLPRSLHRLSTTYLGGLFFNPLHMLLSLMGLLSIFRMRDKFSRLIVTWVAIASLIFPFSRIGVQSHLLFATPFPLLISRGLYEMSRLLSRLDRRLPRLIQMFFLVSSLTYTVRALCNLI